MKLNRKTKTTSSSGTSYSKSISSGSTTSDGYSESHSHGSSASCEFKACHCGFAESYGFGPDVSAGAVARLLAKHHEDACPERAHLLAAARVEETHTVKLYTMVSQMRDALCAQMDHINDLMTRLDKLVAALVGGGAQ